MDIAALVNITSRAWALPILSAFQAGVPGRQAPLLAATGAGRTAFGQSLRHLIDIGLIERNPGHGHPLRPEFCLTARGEVAADIAAAISACSLPQDQPLLRRSWTIPVLSQLTAPRHFNDLGQSLGPVTDRALSQCLQQLETRRWVMRQVDDRGRPPRPLYTAIDQGRHIGEIARRVAA